MSWLDLDEDRIKYWLAEDDYPNIREVHTKEVGTIRRLRVECRVGYFNAEKTLDDECCPSAQILSPPKVSSDIDFDYHPISPKEFLGDGPQLTRLFLADLTQEMDYIVHLRNKDYENIRDDKRKPIEATPLRAPIVVKKRSGDWVGFAHWREGGAFFSSWGHLTTEPDDTRLPQSRPYGKQHHFSVDIITKDFLFYRFDIEQYIVNIWGIWMRMDRPDYVLDRDGPDGPTHSFPSAPFATVRIVILDYSQLVARDSEAVCLEKLAYDFDVDPPFVSPHTGHLHERQPVPCEKGDRIILRATREPTKEIHFVVATDSDQPAGWNPGNSNEDAAISLTALINANENFIAKRDGNVVRIEQYVQGKDGETEVTLVQPHFDHGHKEVAMMRKDKQDFTIKNEDLCGNSVDGWNRTQNLSPWLPVVDGSTRHPQCRIWDMVTRFDEWVDGKKVKWVNGERFY